MFVRILPKLTTKMINFMDYITKLILFLYLKIICQTVWSVQQECLQTMILTASGKSISELRVTINYDLANVKQWLSANKLSLNLIKTEYLLIGSRRNINNISAVPNVSVFDMPIKRVKEIKALGVCIDEF